MNTDELRQAFIFGFAKGIKGDDQDLNTTCPCCDKPMTFGDLPHMVVEGIGDLLDVHLDAPPGLLVNILADYVVEATCPTGWTVIRQSLRVTWSARKRWTGPESLTCEMTNNESQQ